MSLFKVEQEHIGSRADIFVANNLTDISRSSVHKLFKQGKVSSNLKVIKPSYKLKSADKIKVDYSSLDDSSIKDIKLPIIYEDEDCVVINKPAGLLTHSKGAFNPEATIATFVHQLVPKMAGERSGIVHRLDRATSGVIICAKTPEALSWLQKQFSQRKTTKTYVAIVAGHLEPTEAIIEVPIVRNPKRPQTFRAGNGGKSAITQYKVLKSIRDYDYVELQPKTGRTHQLRVHMKYLSHPIVGDTLYNGKESGRLMLHASSLEIILPNRQRKVFEAPIPTDFNQFIKDNS